MLKGRHGSAADESVVWLLCVAVLFPAWAYGGAEAWAIWVLLLSATAVFVASLVRCSQAHGFVSGLFREVWWAVPALVLLVLLGVQTLNPSHVYSSLDQGLTAHAHVVWLPASVDAPSTLLALAYVSSLLMIFFGVRKLRRPRGFILLITAILVSTAAIACLSLLQGSGRERWELVGRFLNENSFAAYMNCVLPVALGAAQALRRNAVREHQRSNPGVLLYFLSGLMATAVLLSGSRAGSAITLLLLACWILLGVRDMRGARKRTHDGWLQLVLPVLFVAAFLGVLGMDILVREARLTQRLLGGQIRDRLLAAMGAGHMFLDAPVFGIGAGTFHAAFPYYRDAALRGFYRHAHNDIVQWLAEVGLVGVGLGAAALAGLIRIAVRQDGILPSSMVRGMVLALVGVALHSCIDFPFRIPAVSVVSVVWLGCLTGSLHGARDGAWAR